MASNKRTCTVKLNLVISLIFISYLICKTNLLVLGQTNPVTTSSFSQACRSLSQELHFDKNIILNKKWTSAHIWKPFAGLSCFEIQFTVPSRKDIKDFYLTTAHQLIEQPEWETASLKVYLRSHNFSTYALLFPDFEYPGVFRAAQEISTLGDKQENEALLKELKFAKFPLLTIHIKLMQISNTECPKVKVIFIISCSEGVALFTEVNSGCPTEGLIKALVNSTKLPGGTPMCSGMFNDTIAVDE